MYADDVLVADSGAELQAILDVVEACVSRLKMKLTVESAGSWQWGGPKQE